MSPIASMLVLFSVLFPVKGWYTPDQPLEVRVAPAGDVTLRLLDFTGKPIDPAGEVALNKEQVIDVAAIWPQARTPGTYVLLAVPDGKSEREFTGTPLVINVLSDRRAGAIAGAMVVRVEPLQYAQIATDQGNISLMFYYDVAPVTCDNFIRLARNGFYDNLLFHRVIDGFVIQTGDPRGDGTGGPGYHVEAEFNPREHREGAVSMARQGDPIEAQGAPPRSDYANSAGSQFFICLNYDRTKQLDGRYTVFAQVVDGMDAVRQIAKTPTDRQTDRPLKPQPVKKIEILPVTSDHNPYLKFFDLSDVPLAPATTAPTTATTSP